MSKNNANACSSIIPASQCGQEASMHVNSSTSTEMSESNRSTELANVLSQPLVSEDITQGNSVHVKSSSTSEMADSNMSTELIASILTQYGQEASPSANFAEPLVSEGISSTSTEMADSNMSTELIASILSQHTQHSTAEHTAESEIDLDNVSMQSDESSFTTNDYSSSQNEIPSDEDYAENTVVTQRVPFHLSNAFRHGGVMRNNASQNSGNSMFINNLEVINNNFYTNIPGERIGNYQRRNTKNNNCQFNNNSNPCDHVSMHNNLQGNRSCKNSNLTSAGSTATPLPGTALFKVSNNSPNKYAVKNTNIANYIPGSSKEVITPSLENRNCERTSSSGENSNVSENNTQAMQDTSVNGESTRVDNNTDRSSPVTEHTEGDNVMDNGENPAPCEPSSSTHQLVSRSTSSRMQKIQNVDCIQNFASSLVLNPSTSALCKTNSFPLCNYIRTQEGSNKCKLIKYNVNASGKLNITGANEVALNNTQPVSGHQNTMSTVTNDITTGNTTGNQDSEDSTVPANDPSLHDTQSRNQNNLGLVENEGSQVSGVNETQTSQVNDKNMCNNSEQCKVSVSLGPVLAKSRSLETNQTSGSEQINQSSITSSVSLDLNDQGVNFVEGGADDDSSVSNTLNNLNNSVVNSIPSTSQNICSLNNNLHRNKKSNLNQLGRRNVSKEDKMFTVKTEPTGQQSTAVTSEASANVSYQMINNSIERNFNKLNSCNQEVNAHKNVKPSQTNRKCKKSRKHVEGVHSAGDVASCSSHSVASDATPSTTRTDNIPSSNLFQDMNEQMNNSTTSNSSRLVYNNNHHAMNTDSTDKNSSKMSTKKDLLNIKRNNFDFGSQEHSYVKRSNSLHVKVNDLASSTTQQNERRTITKSNSFSIRNNISEPGTSQGRNKQQNYSSELNSTENHLNDLKNNINQRLENVDLNADAVSSSIGSNSGNIEVLPEAYARDALEPFRLEEATNDIPDILNDEENDPCLNVESDLTTSGSSEILNNCVDTVETHAFHGSKSKPGTSSHLGSGATSSPQMIHNNIEPRCKKNKKCNEEREPLKPINSENRRKPSEQ